jgi:large subunit ribosomal protein L10
MSYTITSQNRKNKEQLVAELTEKVEKSKGIIFTNYQGLTHQQIEGIKKVVKKLQAEYVTTKNTLLLRALKGKIDASVHKDKFTQPTATLFLYNDIIEPLKHLTKTIKELKLPIIKFGFLEGKVISEADVVKVSTLPPLPILRAQLLGQMKSPIQGLHRALNWNLVQLVMTLDAIKEKKG